MYSSKSVTPGNYIKEMHNADSVLNVVDIEKYADKIGKNVRKVKIEDGIHDLVLSNKNAREATFNEMTIFLNQLEPKSLGP